MSCKESTDQINDTNSKSLLNEQEEINEGKLKSEITSTKDEQANDDEINNKCSLNETTGTNETSTNCKLIINENELTDKGAPTEKESCTDTELKEVNKTEECHNFKLVINENDATESDDSTCQETDVKSTTNPEVANLNETSNSSQLATNEIDTVNSDTTNSDVVSINEMSCNLEFANETHLKTFITNDTTTISKTIIEDVWQESDLRIPFKKRKVLYLPKNDLEEIISYPATPMISIAELEGIKYTRTFRTPAESKEAYYAFTNPDISTIVTGLHGNWTSNISDLNIKEYSKHWSAMCGD